MSAPIDDFDTSRLTDLARTKLTERQFEIWRWKHKFGKNDMQIAQIMRVSLSTVTHELSAARRLLREEIAYSGEKDHPFHLSIAQDGSAVTKEDRTPACVARKLSRAQYRRGRVPLDYHRPVPAENRA